MPQTYQTISRENEGTLVFEHVAEQSALFFMLSAIAQEIKDFSEKLQDAALVSTTFEMVKNVLRSTRTTEVIQHIRSIFSGGRVNAIV